VSRRTTAGLLAAALVVVAGCMVPVVAPAEDGGPVGAAPTARAGSAATWRPCPEVPKDLVGRGAPGMTYECATLAVPRDWAKPGDQTYEVALLRVRSQKQANRVGSLLINPGGPGASGIDQAVYMSFGQSLGGLPADIMNRFDVIGFDPRGVDRSSPVDCVSDTDLDAAFGADPDPETQAEFDAAVALNKKIADGCAQRYGAQLPLFSTEQAARDMDAIRTAVGDEKLTYLGWSYGTLLGATYAQLFPTRVRALVLDGAVDPAEDSIAGSEAQAKGFELAFGNFARWCTETPAKCPVAPDARQALTAALAKGESAPVTGKDGRKATDGWIFLATIASLYSESSWEPYAKALQQLAAGDPAGVFKLADGYADREPSGEYSNLFDANLAVNCADTDAQLDVAKIRDLQNQWRQKYPLFGTSLAVGLLTCMSWPAPRDPYPVGPATGAPPIVVVGTVGDPATPYENTGDLAKMLGVGRVLTWEGEGHTAYPKSACITAAINAYLIDLTVPAEGTRCPA
jgi:pimeloyl-ACP methyl ester carboxylesterase